MTTRDEARSGPPTLRRALVLTAALAACAAPTASGRVADAPVRGGVVSAASAARHAPDPGVPPRVDGIGVQPGRPTGVVAVTITGPSPRHGFDWSSVGIAGAAMILALLGLASRSALAAARAPSRRA
jgi:hypothetical protein